MATKNIGKRVEKKEFVIDASGRSLGRVATEVAHILQGKNKADYVRHLPGENTVRVTNVSQVKMTSNPRGKVYYHHTGYMGHLKELTYEQQFEKDPKKVVEKAVFNMLPKNKLRQRWMNRLKIEV